MLPTATDADPVTRIGAIVALHVLVHAESAHPCLSHDLARYACFSRLESGSVIPDGSWRRLRVRLQRPTARDQVADRCSAAARFSGVAPQSHSLSSARGR